MSAPKAIGAYVKALFPTAHLCFTIGDRLETEQEKENYALWIRERASKMPNARADDMYKRAMNVLDLWGEQCDHRRPAMPQRG